MSSLTPETQTRLQSINRLLEDIYGHPRRLSDKRIWDWGSPKSAIRNPKSETASPASAFTTGDQRPGAPAPPVTLAQAEAHGTGNRRGDPGRKRQDVTKTPMRKWEPLELDS
jgi:hypothetical protein